jgi:hypothetical protein
MVTLDFPETRQIRQCYGIAHTPCTWIDFLSSGFTGHARPQRRKCWTWIVTFFVLLCVGTLITLDYIRLLESVEARNKIRTDFGQSLSTISVTYQLTFLPPELPSNNRAVAGFVIRTLIVVILFPFTVLSHHALLFIPQHWKAMGIHHSAVRLAKVIGLLLLAAGFVALTAGATLRATHPWFSPEAILSAPLTAGANPLQTFEDLHSLCWETGSDWSLMQLAAFPLLAEARGEYTPFYRNLSRLLGIALFEDDLMQLQTTAFIAFNRTTKKLAVGLPVMPFDDNFGMTLENSLAFYYAKAIGLIIPFYDIASDLFLSNLFPGPTETVTTGILGPNRLSEQWLDRVTISVLQELEVVSQVIEALGLSAERPVVVGHGANGLLMKAFNFSDGSDPWRISFESPMLWGSPMATLANYAEGDRTASRILNFYSDGSIYSFSDEAALVNNRIPRYSPRNPIIPPHPFETFCFTVAACGSDPVLDHMCENVLGEGRFENLCTELKRPRSRGNGKEANTDTAT